MVLKVPRGLRDRKKIPAADDKATGFFFLICESNFLFDSDVTSDARAAAQPRSGGEGSERWRRWFACGAVVWFGFPGFPEVEHPGKNGTKR
ncbi:hypothetical protein V5799_018256 [Amblyomma americanum]|uniref:Uncharacterized protein n=1 Tax=Amblyomma americanum TaxID=6943 RepID=A0AAQ4F0V9_AMBAM